MSDATARAPPIVLADLRKPPHGIGEMRQFWFAPSPPDASAAALEAFARAAVAGELAPLVRSEARPPTMRPGGRPHELLNVTGASFREEVRVRRRERATVRAPRDALLSGGRLGHALGRGEK